MTRRTAEERMLNAMVEAARNQPLVELDADRLEADLRRRWANQKMSKPPRSVAWRWVPAIVVGASVLATGLLVRWHRADTVRPKSADSATVQDVVGTNLQPGQTIAADDRAVSVVHPYVARWTLAPHGKAQLVAQGPYLTVSLLEGRIDADVVPSRQRESFAVETKTRRIAVHGTRFSVEQQADATIVEVLAGSVVVGVPGHPGHTEGTLLTPPQKLRFAAVEATANFPVAHPADATEYPAPHKPKSNTTAQAPVNSATNHRVDLDRESETLPQTPAPVEQETALDVVRAAAARCFAQAKTTEDGRESNVTVRVETRMTITIAPSGFLQDADFSPPIPNAIMECTRHEVTAWSTTRTQRGVTASRAIILTR